MPFIFLFLIWPVLEIATFFAVAEEIGFFGALGLIILAGVCGGWILQYQSMQPFLSARAAVEKGRLPSQQLFDAACMTGAALLLIIPGFITDIFALLLLIAPLRHRFREILRERRGLQPGEIIEAEFERVEEEITRIEKKENP